VFRCSSHCFACVVYAKHFRNGQERKLQDAVAKRPVLGKAAYKERIKRICKSKRAQSVAVNIAGGLKKVCLEVVANKGAASRG
jgi:hypothetical protein